MCGPAHLSMESTVADVPAKADGASASCPELSDGHLHFASDSNVRLTRAIAASRRRDTSIGNDGGDVRSHARDAFDAMRLEDRLIVATFATRELGLSLVLSRFAAAPHTPGGSLAAPAPRRSQSVGGLGSCAAAEAQRVAVSDDNDGARPGRSLVLVEDTFPEKGGGVARLLLRPMDELVAIVAAPGGGADAADAGGAADAAGASPTASLGDGVELLVDLDVGGYGDLLRKLRETPRPLTLIFARGAPKTLLRAPRAAQKNGLASKPSPASVPTRRRRAPSQHATRAGDAAAAPDAGKACDGKPTCARLRRCPSALSAALAATVFGLQSWCAALLALLVSLPAAFSDRRDDVRYDLIGNISVHDGRAHRRCSSNPLPKTVLDDLV
ncbi:hypothetical protein M885DRAFT_586041 [Pelagophyceae sp. CCMP2097]|nr:hypothetical protein M885DRAFT_586041 [Pelagophyceae sp. CCMP2097]